MSVRSYYTLFARLYQLYNGKEGTKNYEYQTKTPPYNFQKVEKKAQSHTDGSQKY